MRSAAGLSLAVIVLLLAPALVFAQGLFGLGLPWVPSLSGVSSGSASALDPGGPKCCPVLYLGYEIRQRSDRKPLHFDANLTGSPDGTFALNVDYSEPGGLWLGVSNYCQLSDKIGIMASGWYLFPSEGEAVETYSVPAAGDRAWRTTRSWGWLDGLLVLGSPCGLNLISGFRWDSYSVRMRDPVGIAARGTPLDEANLGFSSYIPLLGTQYCSGGPCCGFLLRVVGFPWVPGRVNYGETGFVGAGSRLEISGNYSRARFIEVFSQYSRNCGSYGCVGIFARWNYLDFGGKANPQILGFIPPAPIGDEEGPIRTSWAIGGNATLTFNLPF
jgi:hypothetical protein